jgi:hypothetical protein
MLSYSELELEDELLSELLSLSASLLSGRDFFIVETS